MQGGGFPNMVQLKENLVFRLLRLLVCRSIRYSWLCPASIFFIYCYNFETAQK